MSNDRGSHKQRLKVAQSQKDFKKTQNHKQLFHCNSENKYFTNVLKPGNLIFILIVESCLQITLDFFYGLMGNKRNHKSPC